MPPTINSLQVRKTEKTIVKRMMLLYWEKT
jgi:hypothetical protein